MKTTAKDSDRIGRTVTMGELIADAFKLVPCKCSKCGTPTDCFKGYENDALCVACDAEVVSASRKDLLLEERTAREDYWNLKRMPLCDTVLEKLPASSVCIGRVLGWEFGKKGLAITGTTGLGKSRTVVQLLRRLWVDEGLAFEYVRTPQWARDLEAASFTAHRLLVTALFRVPVLVLDDVGKERPTERSLAALFDVIDTRTNHGLPVILTSNYTGDKLQARLAERDAETSSAIIRRIREFCSHVAFDRKELKT